MLSLIASWLLVSSVAAAELPQAQETELLALSPEVEQFVEFHVNRSGSAYNRLHQLFENGNYLFQRFIGHEASYG